MKRLSPARKLVKFFLGPVWPDIHGNFLGPALESPNLARVGLADLWCTLIKICTLERRFALLYNTAHRCVLFLRKKKTQINKTRTRSGDDDLGNYHSHIFLSVFILKYLRLIIKSEKNHNISSSPVWCNTCRTVLKRNKAKRNVTGRNVVLHCDWSTYYAYAQNLRRKKNIFNTFQRFKISSVQFQFVR